MQSNSNSYDQKLTFDLLTAKGTQQFVVVLSNGRYAFKLYDPTGTAARVCEDLEELFNLLSQTKIKHVVAAKLNLQQSKNLDF